MAHIIRIQVKSSLQWRAVRSEDDTCWIGVCDAMNLVLEADTLDELYSVIEEGTQLLFLDLLADNELPQFLRERGWQAKNLPSRVESEDVKFNVPWEMVTPRADDSSRRAY